MSPDFWLQVVIGVFSGLGSGVAVYVSIKVDLAITRYKADEALKTADAAHHRLDSFIRGTR